MSKIGTRFVVNEQSISSKRPLLWVVVVAPDLKPSTESTRHFLIRIVD